MAGLSDELTQAVAEKLQEFGLPKLNNEQQLKLAARIHSVLARAQK